MAKYTWTVLQTQAQSILYNKGKYRFAYNVQERINEKAGDNNYYTAPYWEYDPRVVRRDNVDPVFTPGLSTYTVFNSNPIWFNDPLGDYPFLMNPIVATENMKTFMNSFGMAVIQMAGGLTQMWEHGKGNPNAMSLRDIGNGMVRGIMQPVINFANNPNAENLGVLVATGLMFKSIAKESNVVRSVPLETGGRANISLSNLNKALAFEEKAAIFEKNGNLKSEIQMQARKLDNIDMSKTKNQDLIDHLTQDGSTMAVGIRCP